eukprot:scaffold9176_cov129-Cylindrotheca_fusiformis.AAC.8
MSGSFEPASFSRSSFSSTTLPERFRYQVDGSAIDVGVTQRIDGSDSEKEAIREVLKSMDHYFFNEVLAMPEYDYVRPRCCVPSGLLSERYGSSQSSPDVCFQD